LKGKGADRKNGRERKVWKRELNQEKEGNKGK
jgi:hypothetical protein